MLIAMTLVGFASGFLMPRTPPKPRDRSLWEISTGIVRFLRLRPAWLAISASYSSALPASLTQTIYPVYLAALGFGTGWVGAAVSLRSLGVVAAALIIAPLITPAREKVIYGTALAVIGFSLVGSGLSEELLFLSLSITVLGTAGGAMDIFYQVQATQMSKEADRSVAFAAIGLGWTLSHLFSPLLVGVLVEAFGFPFAFGAVGAFMLSAAAGTKLWYRLLASRAPAPQVA
jgi:predicted MFS family arabinose efflux permease